MSVFFKPICKLNCVFLFPPIELGWFHYINGLSGPQNNWSLHITVRFVHVFMGQMGLRWLSFVWLRFKQWICHEHCFCFSLNWFDICWWVFMGRSPPVDWPCPDLPGCLSTVSLWVWLIFASAVTKKHCLGGWLCHLSAFVFLLYVIICNNSSFIICQATFRSCIRFALSSFGNCASRSLRQSDHMTSHICCVWFIPVTNMHASIDHVCLFAPSSQFSLVLPFLEC